MFTMKLYVFQDCYFYPKLLAGTVRFCANEAKGIPAILAWEHYIFHLPVIAFCDA